MSFDKSMTAPLCIIRVGPIVIGKAKNIRITESIRRGDVVGLGKLAATEKPALSWSGTLNMGFYLLDFSQAAIPGSINRNANSVSEWEDTVVLQTDGVQIDIMRKVAASTNANGIIYSQLVVFASVIGNFANRESLDISEGQISGRDLDFDYLTPILYPI